MSQKSDNQIINTNIDSIIMKDKDGVLVISFNKTYNRVYCGNACTQEQLEEFLTYLSKKKYSVVSVLMKGKPEEIRTLIELKSKRKTRKDKGVKRKVQKE